MSGALDSAAAKVVGTPATSKSKGIAPRMTGVGAVAAMGFVGLWLFCKRVSGRRSVCWDLLYPEIVKV